MTKSSWSCNCNPFPIEPPDLADEFGEAFGPIAATATVFRLNRRTIVLSVAIHHSWHNPLFPAQSVIPAKAGIQNAVHNRSFTKASRVPDH